ncbi:MAG: DUF1801 domain-containing protein [Rikenellaceae bacterium]|nr:DUF1801 domain-containing protein [Rikenellaceae bacterium]
MTNGVAVLVLFGKNRSYDGKRIHIDTGSFYLDRPEPVRGTLLALRSLVLGHNKAVSETVKYGMPCFTYRGRILCYLWTDRKTGHPYILMADGNRLRHPALEQGSRARMKFLRVDPYADLPVNTVRAVLDEAIALNTKF